MNIILLSGGSGRRLWPLSNDARSKQFLRLLKSDNGEYESMVQRVYRQIIKSGISANIVVATSASQVDSIRNQLGNNVDIVVEPERRDTFPAIALSSLYLARKKNISMDEAVLVLPVDPYAEIEYFYILKQIELAVKENAAELILMGIKPVYPSEKYGYIVPDKDTTNNNSSIIAVKNFIEKPSLEKAKELIKSGALWNGGVFGFKLGYLIDIVMKYIDLGSFEDLQNNYKALTKISFDYEVVEKAGSVGMIQYNGYWKDLGTWNTLVEEMDEASIGNVILGENTSNSSVINELDIPIVVLGAQNMVIAASPDGILVSDKEKSSYLKSYVQDMQNVNMYEERRWGEYRILEYTELPDRIKSLTKCLSITGGKSISYQMHSSRDEIWTIIDGEGEANLDGQISPVKRGDIVHIKRGMKHSMKAITNLKMIEVQLGESIENEDVQRVTTE